MLTIEPAGPDAAGLLAELHAEAFEEPWSASAFRALFDTPGVFALVGGHGAGPCGFVMARVAVDEAEILTLAVCANSRRLGFATGLMTAAATRAQAAGAVRLFLEVAQDNGPASALYARLGFREVGRRPGYYARPGGSVAARILAVDLGG